MILNENLFNEMASSYKVGDTIKIIEMKGEPNYTGRTGVIKFIDSMGQLHGTWGGLAIVPEEDKIEVISTKKTIQENNSVVDEYTYFDTFTDNQYKLNEQMAKEDVDNTTEVTCDWCNELFVRTDLTETELGNLCGKCIAAIESKEGPLDHKVRITEAMYTDVTTAPYDLNIIKNKFKGTGSRDWTYVKSFKFKDDAISRANRLIANGEAYVAQVYSWLSGGHHGEIYFKKADDGTTINKSIEHRDCETHGHEHVTKSDKTVVIPTAPHEDNAPKLGEAMDINLDDLPPRPPYIEAPKLAHTTDGNLKDGDTYYTITVFNKKGEWGTTAGERSGHGIADALCFKTAERAQAYADKVYPQAEEIMVREEIWDEDLEDSYSSAPYLKRVKGKWYSMTNGDYSRITEGAEDINSRLSSLKDALQAMKARHLPDERDDIAELEAEITELEATQNATNSTKTYYTIKCKNSGMWAGMQTLMKEDGKELYFINKEDRDLYLQKVRDNQSSINNFNEYFPAEVSQTDGWISRNAKYIKVVRDVNNTKYFKMAQIKTSLKNANVLALVHSDVHDPNVIIIDCESTEELRKAAEVLGLTNADIVDAPTGHYGYINLTESLNENTSLDTIRFELNGQVIDDMDIHTLYKLIKSDYRINEFNGIKLIKKDELNSIIAVYLNDTDYIEIWIKPFDPAFADVPAHLSMYLSHNDSEPFDVFGTNLNDIFEALYKMRDKYNNQPVSESLKEDVEIVSLTNEQVNENNGLATVLNYLIKDEFDAIQGYNDAIVNFETEGRSDLVQVLKDIVNEENLHVGQLEVLLEQVNGAANSIDQGKAEAETQLDSQITESYEDSGYAEYTIKYADGSTETVSDTFENGEPNFDITDDYILDTYSNDAVTIIKKVYDENNTLEFKRTIYPREEDPEEGMHY